MVDLLNRFTREYYGQEVTCQRVLEVKHVMYIHILNTVQTIIQCFNSLTTQQSPLEMQCFMPSIFIKNYPISSTPWVKTCIFSCYKDNTTLFFFFYPNFSDGSKSANNESISYSSKELFE